MIDRHWLAVALTAAMPPAPVANDKPAPATTIKGALRNLDREADLLIQETRSYYPLHDTIKDLSERMR
jgi:hypothetical protein